MEEQIRARYRDEILRAFLPRYGIADGQIRPLDAFESFIYEFKRDGREYILRIGHSLRRSKALIQGEVDWINYLAQGGISVAQAILSEHGELVEAVEDGQGGQFMASAFVKAHGRPPWVAGWTPELNQAYGELIGSMHARTISYRPTHPEWKRPAWDDDLFEFVDRFLPAREIIARQRYNALLEHLYQLPKDNQGYGLIHQDAHGSNMLVDEAGRLTLFDFDECAYSWFINDIAIVLFYTLVDAPDPTGFTREFMYHFLTGYRKAHKLDPKWLREIPWFLKLREIELYAVIHRDFDVANIEDAWCAHFMQQRKQKIERNEPFVDFDFETLGEYLTLVDKKTS